LADINELELRLSILGVRGPKAEILPSRERSSKVSQLTTPLAKRK
jgi:hypothetical protein